LIAAIVASRVTHSSIAKAVLARRSAHPHPKASPTQAFQHAGVVSCVGG
jgi:hypothetical protein